MKINQLFIVTTLLVAGPCFAAWTLDKSVSFLSKREMLARSTDLRKFPVNFRPAEMRR
jgi:hypothetical protein